MMNSKIHFPDWIQDMKNQISTVLLGQSEMIEALLAGLFSRGHVLLDGVPGLGKTLAIEALSQTVHGNIKFLDERFDITGTNFLIVDEIHRIDKNTRTVLLRAMQERQIIINNNPYYLDQPFMVVATSNPAEGFSLSAAELDRFMVHYRVKYPLKKYELKILKNIALLADLKIEKIVSTALILELQRTIDRISIPDSCYRLLMKLTAATRASDNSMAILQLQTPTWGISTRSVMYIAALARSLALLNRRTRVKSDDIIKASSWVIPPRYCPQHYSEYEPLELINNLLNYRRNK